MNLRTCFIKGDMKLQGEISLTWTIKSNFTWARLRNCDCGFGACLPICSTQNSIIIDRFQEFVMVLMKLRLNVPLQDLAYHFKVLQPTVSRIFSSWLVVMDNRLSPLVSWPEREHIWRTMPQCFMFSFGRKVTVVFDCFEIFIKNATNPLARAQTFSSDKHHDTIKILIAITPQGTISHMSEAWSGRTSDKYLTENCGFLEHLIPRDMIMAVQGFTITESVGLKHAKLVMPAFTNGKDQ